MYWHNVPDWPDKVVAQAVALDDKAAIEGIDAISPLYCYPVPAKGTMATTDFPSSIGFALARASCNQLALFKCGRPCVDCRLATYLPDLPILSNSSDLTSLCTSCYNSHPSMVLALTCSHLLCVCVPAGRHVRGVRLGSGDAGARGQRRHLRQDQCAGARAQPRHRQLRKRPLPQPVECRRHHWRCECRRSAHFLTLPHPTLPLFVDDKERTKVHVMHGFGW
eukprot:2980657-Pleurochrysis_carterae.AAC.7